MKTKEFMRWLLERGFQSDSRSYYQRIARGYRKIELFRKPIRPKLIRGDLTVTIHTRIILPDIAIINGQKFKFDDATAYLGSLLHANPIQENPFQQSIQAIQDANDAFAKQTQTSTRAIRKMIDTIDRVNAENTENDADIDRKLEQLRKALEDL